MAPEARGLKKPSRYHFAELCIQKRSHSKAFIVPILVPLERSVCFLDPILRDDEHL